MLVVILLAMWASLTYQMQIIGKNITGKIKNNESLYGQHLRVSAFHVIFTQFTFFFNKKNVLIIYICLRSTLHFSW
jgi:hypothetical protein